MPNGEFTALSNVEYKAFLKASPYSYENPIRKIDGIKYIQQPTGYLCGQSVIAMLAGVDVDEAIKVMNTDKGTSTPMLRAAMKYYGIKTTTDTRKRYTPDTVFTDCCVMHVMLPTYGHWTMYYKGMYYDPEFGVLESLLPSEKIRYYWEIVV